MLPVHAQEFALRLEMVGPPFVASKIATQKDVTFL
jgi:hypothetical protein